MARLTIPKVVDRQMGCVIEFSEFAKGIRALVNLPAVSVDVFVAKMLRRTCSVV